MDQPALVLSDPETGEDGFLTMGDVFGLKLNADLVSLSACNTGLGESVRGEGVMGLTRAFMFAGTPAVTVTLHEVESESAKVLNVGFYTHLKNGENRAAALRKIKLEMLAGKHGEKWRHPYYWSPVVVFGMASISPAVVPIPKDAPPNKIKSTNNFFKYYSNLPQFKCKDIAETVAKNNKFFGR